LQPTAALLALAPGRLIAGKYRLTREIGHGGMGAVWEALHETLERPVAVKFLKPWTNADEARAERFVSEAQMVAALKHRFVVDVFDFGVSDEGLYFMVLELLNGRTLAHRLEHGPAFGVHAAIHVIADCLRGLHAVHEAGIVHRDLKPDNIVLVDDVDGIYPKLIDFGISKRKENELTPTPTPADNSPRKRSRLTAPGMVIGTLDYMPPEQLRGRDDLDRRADVYSMGVILYEWLAGHVPFEQDNIADLMVAITVAGAPPLSRARLDLGPRISGVLAKALASRADDRYPTALALREALLAALSEIPADAVSGRVARVPLPASARYSEYSLPTQPQSQSATPMRGALPPSAAAAFAPAPVDPDGVDLGASHTRARVKSRLRPVLLVLALVSVFGLGAWAVFRPRTPVSVLKPRAPVEAAPAAYAEPPAPALPPPAAAPVRPREARSAARERAEAKAVPGAPGTPDAPGTPARARTGRASKAKQARSAAAAAGAEQPRKIYRELDF
jgi:eukaryotic-like serine/threonine-protein kinase